MLCGIEIAKQILQVKEKFSELRTVMKIYIFVRLVSVNKKKRTSPRKKNHFPLLLQMTPAA